MMMMIPQSSNHYRQPNVIARLMGMDDVTAAIVASKPQQQVIRHLCSGREGSHLGTGGSSSSSRRTTTTCGLHGMRKVPPLRPWQRHHPQQDEELLRKMRHDLLQAWQQQPPAAVVQAMAQEKLRREKMARYGLVVVAAASNGNSSKTTTTQQQNGDDGRFRCNDDRDLEAAADGASSGRGDLHGGGTDNEMPPTPIVLLKPTVTAPHHQQGPSSVFRRLPKLMAVVDMDAGDDTSRLLKEVKQRLRRQLKVNAAAAGAATEAEPTTPQTTTCREEDAAHRHGSNRRRLFRSESFRAFLRSDDRRRRNDHHHASPDEAQHGSRPLPLGRLGKKSTSAAASAAGTVSPPPEKGDQGSLTVSDYSGGDITTVVGQISSSFRSDDGCLLKSSSSASPPRPLLRRSLSAPESFSAFFSLSLGSLFASARRRTTEQSAASQVAATNGASFGFKIRGTVSSLRRSFRFRRRKTHTHTQWLWSKEDTSLSGIGRELHVHPHHQVATPPPSPHQTFSLFKVAQANLTELPPSPVSPLEVVGCSRHFFSDLHHSAAFFPAAEPSPKSCVPEESQAPAYGNRTITAEETACDRDKAYIRELLIAAGLYHDDGSAKAIRDRVDSMARRRPICDTVFEEVEDMYYYRGDYCGGSGVSENATGHRMLFDLANEALQNLAERSSSGPASSSLCQRAVLGTAGAGASRGRELEDDVWQQVQALRKPRVQEMQTIDSMVAYQVRKSVWTVVLHEDVYAVGRKIERAIFDELVQETFCS